MPPNWKVMINKWKAKSWEKVLKTTPVAWDCGRNWLRSKIWSKRKSYCIRQSSLFLKKSIYGWPYARLKTTTTPKRSSTWRVNPILSVKRSGSMLPNLRRVNSWQNKTTTWGNKNTCKKFSQSWLKREKYSKKMAKMLPEMNGYSRLFIVKKVKTCWLVKLLSKCR